MLEQLPLIKQNYTFPNEHLQCLTTNEATSQLAKSSSAASKSFLKYLTTPILII